jgi:trehalose-phosphatase
MVKYLFGDWETIQARIQQAQNLFLLLDYDGTLAPIAPRPEMALCPPGVKRLLKRLRDLPGVYLAIISGRSIKDVREKVGLSGIVYVGNHGLEIENPDGRDKKILAPNRRREIKTIARHLRNSLKDIPGIIFEDKGPILSVHYRIVPRKFLTQVSQTVETELQQWRKRWKIASGKKVLEIRPRLDFNKGKAVREILKGFSSKTLLAIYLGDDQTDEDAFRVVKGRGIAVLVRMVRLSSEADFFLRSPDEVKEFLSRCCEARRKVSLR